MYDQRPMEVLASYAVAMALGAVIFAAFRYYGDLRARNAQKVKGE